MEIKTTPERGGGQLWLTALINIVVFFSLLAAVEIAARIYIAWAYGTQMAGMEERTQYLSYQPFVMYGPDWDQVLGSIKHTASGACRVVMVGGSAAAKFPIKTLENALSAEYKGKIFEVINASYGGYEARQEVIVASIWVPRLRPDLLLSFDGGNDLEHRLRVKKAGTFYLNSTYKAYLENSWLGPVYYLASKSQAYNAILRLLARRSVGEVTDYADAIPVYLQAQSSLNDVSRGIGAARLMVLQPYSAFKTPLSKQEAAFTAFKYREPVMKALYSRTEEGLAALSDREQTPLLDARSIFDNVTEQMFVDDFHLTDGGYSRMAQAIAAKLHTTWPAPCSP